MINGFVVECEHITDKLLELSQLTVSSSKNNSLWTLRYDVFQSKFVIFQSCANLLGGFEFSYTMEWSKHLKMSPEAGLFHLLVYNFITLMN